VQALAVGAFERGELPSADRFYPAYLARLRERVGDTLYEGVYRPLLLFLIAAQGPVTLDQLAGWGLRRDGSQIALYDIADFIEGVRARPWHERVVAGDKLTLPEGATDASMAPHHVARSKLFVRERSAKALVNLDTAEIEANIEHTRFPVPEHDQHECTDDFPGLVRAAVLIGQLADINYLRKQSALFSEFRETGVSNKLNYNSVADLRANYPDFFWKTVRPYIGDALRFLRVTQEGQQWIANLYAHVFSIEHRSELSR
jgi:hypothetical protein